MTATLNNSYLVKVSTLERGVKIAQNSVHVVCSRPFMRRATFISVQDRIFFVKYAVLRKMDEIHLKK